MRQNATKYLVYLAVFICLNIILTRVAGIRIAIAGIEAVRFGLGAFPVIISGIVLGPNAGAIVGAVGDVIGYQLNPMGAYMPCFTLTAALTGFLPALLLRIFKLEISFWSLTIVIALSQLLSSLLLVPYFLNVLFGMPYAATIPARVISYLITVPVYAYLAITIFKRTVIGNLFSVFRQKKEIIRHKV